MKLHLIQPLFHSDNGDREEELRRVEAINRLRFGDDLTAPVDHLSFSALFALCRSDAINIIANSDIAFDETAELFHRIPVDEAWCLSRWERAPDGAWSLNARRDSQDVWVLRGQPRADLDAPFRMGQPGADNRLVHLLREAGYTVRNPSPSIRCLHYHASPARNYRQGNTKINVVPPPYAYVFPRPL
jgi:hypothetical protein